MLVCSVSLRPPRRSIAADIAEAAAALDASTTGTIVFAALVDDPASVLDTVDAYLGEIMLEAASATDDLSAGSGFDGAVDETASAAEWEDGSVIGAPSATWNPSDKTSNIVLTNSNLSVGSSVSSTEGVRATAGIAVGSKKYFEVSFASGTAGNNTGCGIVPLATSLSSFVSSSNGGLLCINFANSIYYNGSPIVAFGGPMASHTLCLAVDMANYRFWVRTDNGIWNNSGTADPATNVGGIDISSVFTGVTAYPVASMHTTLSPCSTVNFGPSFAYSVPSGFSTI